MSITDEDMLAARKLLSSINELACMNKNQTDLLLPGVATAMHARWKAGYDSLRQYMLEVLDNMKDVV